MARIVVMAPSVVMARIVVMATRRLAPDSPPLAGLGGWEHGFCVQFLAYITELVIFAAFQTFVGDGPASRLFPVSSVTSKPEGDLVVPDSNWVIRRAISRIRHLQISMVDSDEVSSVQVQVLDAEQKIAVVDEVLWLLHVYRVLARRRLLVVSVVVVAEHRYTLIVEVVAAEVSIANSCLVLEGALRKRPRNKHSCNAPENW